MRVIDRHPEIRRSGNERFGLSIQTQRRARVPAVEGDITAHPEHLRKIAAGRRHRIAAI
jgi:hypothetical protein